jgi:hypothetical protein
MTRARNARFWVTNSASGELAWCKLTLRPGQSLEHYCGGPTDEGWWSHSALWALDAREGCEPVLRQSTTSDGSDCDGRVSHHRECHARLDRSRVPHRDPMYRPPMPGLLPDWVEDGHEVNDRFARAAGY